MNKIAMWWKEFNETPKEKYNIKERKDFDSVLDYYQYLSDNNFRFGTLIITPILKMQVEIILELKKEIDELKSKLEQLNS